MSNRHAKHIKNIPWHTVQSKIQTKIQTIIQRSGGRLPQTPKAKFTCRPKSLTLVHYKNQRVDSMASPYKNLRVLHPNQISVKLLIYYSFSLNSYSGNLF